MSTTATESSSPTLPAALRARIVSLQGLVAGVESDARGRLVTALKGATASLRHADAALERLGREQWTARAIRRRVEEAGRAGTATLLHRAATVADRADKLPAIAVEKLVGAGTTSLRALSSRVERAAEGLAKPAADAQPKAN
jgi:hypothetical protein